MAASYTYIPAGVPVAVLAQALAIPCGVVAVFLSPSLLAALAAGLTTVGFFALTGATPALVAAGRQAAQFRVVSRLANGRILEREKKHDSPSGATGSPG